MRRIGRLVGGNRLTMRGSFGNLRYLALFHDDYSDNRAVGALNNTPSSDGKDTRTVTDAENKLSNSGGKMVCAGGGAAPTWGNPAIRYSSRSRQAGRCLLADVLVTSIPVQGFNIGWFTGASITTNQGNGFRFTPTGLRSVEAASTSPGVDVAAITVGNRYPLAAILRNAGAFLLAQLDGVWQLIWPASVNTGATLWPGISNHDSAFSIESLYVDDLLLNKWGTDFGIATGYAASAAPNTTISCEKDYVAEATWTPQAGETLELSPKYKDADNRLVVRCNQAGGTIKLLQRIGGAETELNSTTQTWTAGTAYRVIVFHNLRSVAIYVQPAGSVAVLKFTNPSLSYNNGYNRINVNLSCVNLAAFPLHFTNLYSATPHTNLAVNRAYARNAAAALTIPTYEGSGQCTHPDVYDAGAGQAWNGYRYWMAFTPYPGADDTYENPSIVASNDGLTWVVPAGLTNPIDPKPNTDYNSDPDLTMVNGVLWCIYRQGGVTDKIQARYSSNGVNWSEEQTLLTLAHATNSPAVVKVGSTYYMYLVDDTTTPNTVIRYSAPAISGPWALADTCTLTMPTDEPWHIDVLYDGIYYAVVNSNAANQYRLYFAVSIDGVTWTVSSAALLGPGPGWDGSTLYRGSMVRTATGFDLWYGGTLGGVWKIGKTEIGF